jgi:hypothetical protein
MNQALGRFAATVVLLAGVILGGCQSTWERAFEPERGFVSLTYPEGEGGHEVVVRRVPWERLRIGLEGIERSRAESDVHPDDWSEQRRLAERAELLRTLHVDREPEEVVLLGRSQFKSTWRISPDDGSLARFARSIGADYAIWSNRSVGKAQRIEHRSVPTDSYSTIRYYDKDSGKYRTATRHTFSTTQVPVAVWRDETAFVVYYLRLVR